MPGAYRLTRREVDLIPHFHAACKASPCPLSPRDEQTLRMRFGLDGKRYALKEIGERFAVSRSRAQQIEKRAIKKLEDWMWRDVEKR